MQPKGWALSLPINLQKVQHKVFCSINSFSADYWDPHHNGSFFFKYDFLKALYQAGVEDANYRYLSFSERGKAVGVAVLSQFNLHLDLLSGNHPALRLLKKIKPGILQFPAVFAGIPCSFGQAPFYVFDPSHQGEVILLINQELQRWAKEEKIPLKIWKELSTEQISGRVLGKLGYLEFPSLPDMQLQLPETSVNDFLCQIRSDYRRKFKRSLERWEINDYKLADFTTQDVDTFFEGYSRVMSRTKTKLEVYNKSFFRELALAKLKVKILTIEEGDKIISALLIEDEQALSFMLVAKPCANYQNGLYNQLLQIIGFLGVKSKMPLIRFGQTSMYSKAAIGCSALPLKIYLQHQKPHFHFLLKHFGKLLFPLSKAPQLRVFKNKRNSSKEYEKISA